MAKTGHKFCLENDHSKTGLSGIWTVTELLLPLRTYLQLKLFQILKLQTVILKFLPTYVYQNHSKTGQNEVQILYG
jgi:hypothetical protein